MDDPRRRIREALADLDREGFLEALQEALNSGADVDTIVFEDMSWAMDEIGRRFEMGEYFLADLLYAAEIFKEAMKILEPHIASKHRGEERRGVVVLGTVKGDIHDIGKSLVATLLRLRGFQVIDLGVDVPPEKFVEAARKHNPHIIGLSALLTTAIPSVKETIAKLREAGVAAKIMVGGAALSEKTAREVGADLYAENAVQAVRVAEKVVERASRS